jgi:hypothetical protein
MKRFGAQYLNDWEDEKEEKEAMNKSLPVAHFKTANIVQPVSNDVTLKQAIVNELAQVLSYKWADTLAVRILSLIKTCNAN